MGIRDGLHWALLSEIAIGVKYLCLTPACLTGESFSFKQQSLLFIAVLRRALT